MLLLARNSVYLPMQHTCIGTISQLQDPHCGLGQLFEGQGHFDP